MIRTFYWLISALLAFSCGILLLNFLVARPLRMSLYLAGVLCVVFVWVVIAWRYFQGWNLYGIRSWGLCV